MCPSLNDHFGRVDGNILIDIPLDVGAESNPRLNLLEKDGDGQRWFPKEIQDLSPEGML